MTLILCVVIFTELALQEFLDNPDGRGKPVKYIFYVINYFLLSFFVIEICLKLFGYFLDFLCEFINVFDSIVVIISFVF
jgi:hypothetical protein